MKRVLTLLPLAALALSACGSDDEAVSIDGAWARTSAAGQTTGAIYFDLTVEADDTLLGASVPASVAGDAQVHEVVMAAMDDDMSGDDMSDDDMSGDEMDDSGDAEGSDDMGDTSDTSDMEGMDPAMTMQELTDGLALNAGETVTFEPGGYHVMLLDLVEPLEVGDEIELTLQFAEAGDTTLNVDVAVSAP